MAIARVSAFNGQTYSHSSAAGAENFDAQIELV